MPARQVPALWRSGDAAAARQFCERLRDQPEALPEVLLLLGMPGLDAPALRVMAPKLFSDEMSDIFVATLARLFSRLGVYGYSFPRWRFLSMGARSLLERFGMQRLTRETDFKDASLPDPARHLFGPGFCREAGNIYIEYRRAYLLIASPAAALVIRNNSYYFGRDRLSAPVLINCAPPNAAGLQALRPETFASWTTLEQFAEDNEELPLSEKLMRLESLLAMLDAYDTSLEQWLLDARGGLTHTIEFLEGCSKNGMALPVLTALPRYAPPWQPSAVAPVTPALLAEMKSLVRGDIPGPLLQPVITGLAAGDIPALLTGQTGDFPA